MVCLKANGFWYAMLLSRSYCTGKTFQQKLYLANRELSEFLYVFIDRNGNQILSFYGKLALEVNLANHQFLGLPNKSLRETSTYAWP